MIPGERASNSTDPHETHQSYAIASVKFKPKAAASQSSYYGSSERRGKRRCLRQRGGG
eukprot:c20680_g3_i1 orf=271-444(+)